MGLSVGWIYFSCKVVLEGRLCFCFFEYRLCKYRRWSEVMRIFVFFFVRF